MAPDTPARTTADRARTRRVIAAVPGLQARTEPVWADAVTVRPVGPGTTSEVSLVGTQGLPADTRIAVKTTAALRWRRTGIARPGHWLISRPRHERRCAAGAAYLLVFTDRPQGCSWEGVLVPAGLVDECLDDRWRAPDGTGTEVARLPWPQVAGEQGGACHEAPGRRS
jgi:hypothetical protein